MAKRHDTAEQGDGALVRGADARDGAPMRGERGHGDDMPARGGGSHGEGGHGEGGHGKDHEERKPTKLRTANGIAAAILCIIFLAHAILGSVKFAVPTFSGRFVWVVWIGVGILVAHVVMSVGTTVSMMTDKERPPSAKKKRHQLMKWLSGVAVLVVAVIHMLTNSGLVTGGAVPALSRATTVLMAALICALGWHMFTASKSLLKDLHVPNHKRWRPALRAVLLAGCVVAGVILLVAAFA